MNEGEYDAGEEDQYEEHDPRPGGEAEDSAAEVVHQGVHAVDERGGP